MLSERSTSAVVLKLGDDFELDLSACELRKRGKPQRIARIPMDLLQLLVHNRGQLVTRDAIVERIWGKDVFLDTDNSINAAIRKIRQALRDNPDEPRFVQTVIGRGYRFVAQISEVPLAHSGNGLHRNGVDPGASGPLAAGSGESSEAVQGTNLGLPVGDALGSGLGRSLWRRSGAFAIVAAVLALSLATTLGGVRARLFHRVPAEPASAFKARPSVAVLEFKNLSDREDQAWVSTALSELLSADLAAGQQLRIISGEDVARMKVDLSLAAASTYSGDTLTKIRSRLGSDLLVLGSYLAVGKGDKGKIRINLQVQDARTGEIVAEVSEDGTEAELAELVSRSGDNLRKSLRIGGVTADDAVQIRASLPANSEAARAYAEGLVKMRSFDMLAARDLFLHAIALDSDHALSHAALSECWSNLGYDSKAQDEGKKALELSSKLPREEQLAIEGRYRVAAREWSRAIEIYRMLWEFFPDNPDYGLELANVQVSAMLGKDALTTVEKLSSSAPAEGSDPRIDLAAATAAENVGEFKRAQELATAAATKGGARSARLVVAQAKLLEGVSFDRLGESERAAASLQESEAAFAQAGDSQGAARSVLEAGIVFYDRGDLDGARTKFEQSLAVFRRLGAKRNMARALRNMGNVLYDQGKLNEALSEYQQALAVDRETGFQTSIAGDQGNIANVLDSLGRLNEAREMQDHSLAAYLEAGDTSEAAITLNNLGNLYAELGDLPEATQSFERAAKFHQETGHKRGSGFALTGWGLVLLEQDRLAEARSKLEEALAIRKGLGDQSTLAQSQLSLAEVSLEENDAVEAEKLVREAATQFAKDKSVENETVGYARLARALLVQERLPEARAAADQAILLSRNTGNLSAHFEASIASAMVGSTSGSTVEARSKLDEVIAETKRLGFVGYELRARLDRGQLELRSGKAVEGQAYLESVRQDAMARGFRLVARKSANVDRIAKRLSE
jgi:tetratricopeptide (TPR) repeat protein/DNA-binding winged helix-turn-helix (wHTH) protein